MQATEASVRPFMLLLWHTPLLIRPQKHSLSEVEGPSLLSEFSKPWRVGTEKDCLLISLEYLGGKWKHLPVGFGNKLIRHFVLTSLSPCSVLISSRFLL